jgi:aspartate/methionine/tyrosine aminotransferase
MKSSRLPSDLSQNATTRTLGALKRRGLTVVDLTVSNPTRVGLSYPADLLSALADPAALVYDPQPLGSNAAREAVSADFARRGLTVAADRIALTASTSEAYAWLFKLFCDAGDSVLVPRPSYPLFEHLTVLESVEARPYRVDYHGAWRIDLGHLAEAIDDRTRAILVVSPNNPTGSFLHRDDLMAVAALCESKHLALIGDEVFTDFAFDTGIRRPSVLEAEGVLSCSLGGLSKSAGLPQVKLGWIGFGGPATRVREVVDAFEVVADTYLSVSTPIQIALPSLIEQGAGIREQIRARTRRNLGALREAVDRHPAISLLHVEGGWSAVLQVPAYRSEESLVLELLTAEHVLVHPGFFFDFEREAFLVVSLLVEDDLFDRGISRVLARASQPSLPS